MRGQDSLREWLQSQGFRCSVNGLRSEHNLCDWYAWRRSVLDARRCECNDTKEGVQIVVQPYTHDIDGLPESSAARNSVELRITAEAGGIWWDLKAYSLKPEELRERLPEIERMLVSAWNGLVP
jgi:hypothetical protein